MQLNRRAVVPVCALLVTGVVLAGCNGSSSPPSASAAKRAGTTAVSVKPPVKRCPLTGAPRHKGENIRRPALAVKIDNVSEALPQSGLDKADVVIEELVEGGLTRLMAIYQCDSASTVGPIRSARISDADLLALLHGSVFGYSGANPKDMPPIIDHSGAVLLSQDSNPQYYYRSGAHIAPHNVYSSTSRILKAGIARRKSLKAPRPLFRYGAAAANAKRAHHIAMTWPAASAGWTWKHGLWRRTQNGAPDVLSNGKQLAATNVVVMNVTIASTGLHDVLGSPSPEDVTVGSNPVWIFRGGTVVKGTWHRRSITSRITFTDSRGRPLALAPGRTWVELLPKGSTPAHS